MLSFIRELMVILPSRLLSIIIMLLISFPFLIWFFDVLEVITIYVIVGMWFKFGEQIIGFLEKLIKRLEKTSSIN